MRCSASGRFRDALPALLAATSILGACTGGIATKDRGGVGAPAVDRAAAQGQVIASYLETLARLSQAAPAEQAEIFAGVKRDYDLAPTASHQLRYALALSTGNHGSYDPALAQRLLHEILATPETLLPAERAIANLELQSVDRVVALAAENRRLQAEAGRGGGERERAAVTQRRLQVQIEENARLREALSEARAKLDAIANIEGSINERRPQNEGRSP